MPVRPMISCLCHNQKQHINGASGEGYMLTEEERMKLAEKWMEVAPKGFKVIVHVGSCAPPIARHGKIVSSCPCSISNFPSLYKQVIVHVGSTCVKTSRNLAAHAQEIGAWGIGAMATPFPKIGRVEELVKYCEEIACGAPQLPFYYYHIPAFNNAYLSMVGNYKSH